jgi:predicted amino acid-binding ACT domain protein
MKKVTVYDVAEVLAHHQFLDIYNVENVVMSGRIQIQIQFNLDLRIQ